jgi:rhomboid domain-containing protein 1
LSSFITGVIFALKLITTLENPEGYSYVQGFRVPTRYTAWAELIAIHLLVPNASFIGHLAGILAGLIYMKTFVGSIIDFYLTLITGTAYGNICLI